ncbi:hypothetical protein L1049_026810 [Liquidambar formosana]|uniref:Uncharacterized protein n=1 Tax=Liquidambar formosana TaxID=63359 RepID=A0AAP0NG72_LIQFO
MDFSKATQVMLLAIFVAIFMLISSEVATAMFHDAVPGLKLGRRVLQAGYNTTGRGGYN